MRRLPPLAWALPLTLCALACTHRAEPEPGPSASDRAAPTEPTGPTKPSETAPRSLAVVELRPPGSPPQRVGVELALTDAERARGLMFRERLDEGRGMLFVFSGDDLRSFWMRNTLIPLDMIFISSRLEVVGVVHNATPLTEAPRGVNAKSQYVLEVPGGWAEAHGVERGCPVQLEGVPLP